MTRLPSPLAEGRSTPTLVLCRQCVQYVFEGTVTCPHCGGDVREIGPRYREGPYRTIEAMQQIERVLGRCKGSAKATDTNA
jgi:hypothetical protein